MTFKKSSRQLAIRFIVFNILSSFLIFSFVYVYLKQDKSFLIGSLIYNLGLFYSCRFLKTYTEDRSLLFNNFFKSTFQKWIINLCSLAVAFIKHKSWNLDPTFILLGFISSIMVSSIIILMLFYQNK